MIQAMVHADGSGKKLDLVGGWSKIQSVIADALGGGIFLLLTVVGLLLIVGGIADYLWKRHKNGQGDTKRLAGALLVGTFLAAPMILIPLVLYIFQQVGEIIVGILNATVKH